MSGITKFLIVLAVLIAVVAANEVEKPSEAENEQPILVRDRRSSSRRQQQQQQQQRGRYAASSSEESDESEESESESESESSEESDSVSYESESSEYSGRRFHQRGRAGAAIKTIKLKKMGRGAAAAHPIVALKKIKKGRGATRVLKKGRGATRVLKKGRGAAAAHPVTGNKKKVPI